ncbi:DUF3224 domain-containing protein [Umezawaea beigongshangensis]|uniref:DUF3224 domain-containing protein n=1 Tax=Umezawaea beigongshangensis TaxID=2780383 RepID=UPI0018F172CB|nr:DUF3224 domain-containing protein [Umezawaea beigongshangensis]
MSTHLDATFTITRWEGTPFAPEAGGPELAVVDVAKTYGGELSGTSTGRLTTCVAAGGSAGYVGTERVVGTLAGRSGSFVLQHGATTHEGVEAFVGYVVPGSGTGELTGLSGTAKLVHEAIELDYDLPS